MLPDLRTGVIAAPAPDRHPCYKPGGSVCGDPNVPGDFHVEADCCTLCGVPWHYAPDLFSYDDHVCWVSRQPQTTAERDRMIAVFEVQELGCVQYRGTDPAMRAIVDRLS